MTDRNSDNKQQQSAGRAEKKAAEQVDEVVQQETEQGFRGTEVDPTPNENYTVKGVTAGAPTPENDPDQAEKAGSTKRFDI